MSPTLPQPHHHKKNDSIDNQGMQMVMVFDDDDDDDDEHSVSLDGGGDGGDGGGDGSDLYDQGGYGGSGIGLNEGDNSSVAYSTGTEGESTKGGSRSSDRHPSYVGGGNGNGRGTSSSSSNANHHRNDTMGEFFQNTLNNGMSDGVVCFKLLVVGMLIIASLVIGNAAFVYTTSEITETYKSELRLFEDILIYRSLGQITNLFKTTQSLRDNIISYTMDSTTDGPMSSSSNTWPYVNVPDFEARHVDFVNYHPTTRIQESSSAEDETTSSTTGKNTVSSSFSLASEIVLIPLVDTTKRKEWETWSVLNQNWIQDGIEFQQITAIATTTGTTTATATDDSISSYIHLGKMDDNEELQRDTGTIVFSPSSSSSSSFLLPIWETSPVPTNPHDIVNYNSLASIPFREALEWMKEHSYTPVLTKILKDGDEDDEEGSTTTTEPHSYLLQPIFESLPSISSSDTNNNNNNKLVGILRTTIEWSTLFQDALPYGIDGVIIVLSNNECGQVHTFEVNGPTTTYLGKGDLHDLNHEALKKTVDLQPSLSLTNTTTSTYCQYTITIYPSSELKRSYDSNEPFVFTASVVLIFVLATCLFGCYDCMVERRQNTVAKTATRTNALVSSLFPEQVRNRLMDDNKGGSSNNKKQQDEETDNYNNHNQKKDDKHDKGTSGVGVGVGTVLAKTTDMYQKAVKSQQNKGEESVIAFHSKPIADLFPSTTVMFGDIKNFTAWSSVREPTQVFSLLEGVYKGFDMIAKRRRVFKVETVGDSYVAVCGLPEPRSDHAVVMARFAQDCALKFREVVKKMELNLGPGTADLTMRFGLHSGPVTGGVLRGEKSRFQLFGDTVNTAARMESTGKPQRIQVSQEVADHLFAADKGSWLKARDTLVHAKGKGEMRTYWLDLKRKSTSSSVASVGSTNLGSESSVGDNFDDDSGLSLKGEQAEMFEDTIGEISTLKEKTYRSVQWTVQMLLPFLKKISALRDADVQVEGSDDEWMKVTSNGIESKNIAESSNGMTVLDQCRDIITLPSDAAKYKRNWEDVDLGPLVEAQLESYVTTIASMYRSVPFHCFEHASHVCMSAIKLLTRVVQESNIDLTAMCHTKQKDYDNLHVQTYGITSDPLTQFAVIFSALIHDVDHTGVPNAQLVKEKSFIANIYNNKSVAEQNSVDLAWGLLMEPSFQDLRNCLCATKVERERFRQLVVNSVMATDIADKELGAQRRQRWEKAFSGDRHEENPLDERNRKATIVIEHLIQASDVSHTMQHWHIYQKWNQKLFEENYRAYMEGRSEMDPTVGWYKGELGFFDFYLIPLAKKLRDCGVFGVSSDEYLNYANTNRREWEKKGEEITQRFQQQAIEKYSSGGVESFQ